MAVITISRQIGSGCPEVVRQVCDRLGYTYFDKRALVDEALKLGLTEQEIVDLTEETYKAKNLLENLFMPGPRRVCSTEVELETEDGIVKRYVRHLDEIDCIGTIRTVIKRAYERGNVVIVGRGGQVVLQRKPDVLHVLMVAPLEARVERVMREQDISEADARRYIQQRDKATREYLQLFFKVKWDDPTLYNLTLDTSKMSLEVAAQTIVEAVERLPVPA